MNRRRKARTTAQRVQAVALYGSLCLFAFLFLLPMYVMLINSVKPLAEIQAGGMMYLPEVWTLEPWRKAWSTAQVGVESSGLRPFFLNSLLMVIPAVFISTVIGAVNGYILTQWVFRGHKIVFLMMLGAVFIPYQIVLIPMARMLGVFGLAGTIPGLILVHTLYGMGFTTLFFRNYYADFPVDLMKAAKVDGAGLFRIFFRIMLPASTPIIIVTVIWQFTNIWNDFLFGVSFSDFDSFPMTVALNNLVNTSTGVKEYNVHFAGAFIAAIPTLLIYIFAGRFFVRGLTSGSVKG